MLIPPGKRCRNLFAIFPKLVPADYTRYPKYDGYNVPQYRRDRKVGSIEKSKTRQDGRGNYAQKIKNPLKHNFSLLKSGTKTTIK
jgi:hypothetical protein